MAWADNLTEEHLKIAGSKARRISVLAGPGTGKTALGMMRRVARLLEEGLPPEELLLISFTRTAAQDLRDKIANLGVQGAAQIRATTLHSFCFSMLRREAVLTETRRNPRTLLDHETALMIKDIKGNFGNQRE